MKNITCFILFLTFLTGCSSNNDQSKSQVKKLNIILLLADDMGYGDLAFYGGQTVHTPNINDLASQRIRFIRYYSASAVCSPSRIAILTGKCPFRFDNRRHLRDVEEEYLPITGQELPRLLKEVGYSTSYMGKWHLGGIRTEDIELYQTGEKADPGSFQHGFDHMGFFPQNIRQQIVKDTGNLFDNIQQSDYPLQELLQLVEMSSDKEKINSSELKKYLEHTEVVFRFWATSGFVNLYMWEKEKDVPEELSALLRDKDPGVAANAAEALVYAGQEKQGADALVEMVCNGNGAAKSALEEVWNYFEADKNQIEKLKELNNQKDNFSVRSILINQGELPFEELFKWLSSAGFKMGAYKTE